MTAESTGLKAQGIRVRLGEKQVLQGVDAGFAPGKVTAVVGPNGAGKSTLMECLAGLRRPEAGEVFLDQARLLGLAPRERAKRIAFLPQSAEVAWAVDVRTFVGLGRTAHVGAFGLGSEDHQAVDAAMAAAGVDHFARRVVTTLSGGERARVLIARALAGDPRWLLADEPLAGLDPGHVIDAGDLFRRLAHSDGRGVIVTLHDLAAALKMADRVIVVAAGRVLADDAPQAALTPDVLRSAYGVEARMIEAAGGVVLDVMGRTETNRL